jgi:UrcA family protein
MKTAITLIAAFAVLAAPAVAENGKTPYQFELDLTGADTPAGAARIYSDIRRQAVRVCSPLLSQDQMLTKAARECRAEVIAEAVKAANQPLVYEAHRQDEGERRYASE